jgi:hypothetical protein
MNSRSFDSVFLPQPDPSCSLPGDVRERLRHLLNTHALERLLARMKPEGRNELLRSYVELAARGKVALGPMVTDGITDPEIRRLFEEISAGPER